MGNQLRSPTNIGHLSLSDSSTDDYLYVQGVPITGASSNLNIQNGEGTLSLKQLTSSDDGLTFSLPGYDRPAGAPTLNNQYDGDYTIGAFGVSSVMLGRRGNATGKGSIVLGNRGYALPVINE